ncbi:MAG: PHB depolymerase family esterase [Bacteroidota bacterium]
MKQIESSLIHRVIPPALEKPGPPYPTMVLLHGRGTDENDLLGLTPYFDERLLFISVRAPHPFSFGGGYAWYEVLQVGAPEPNQFAESYERLSSFLNDIRKEYPVDPSRLYFFGFSMGTVMAYAITLTRPDVISAVVAHSGYVPEDSGLSFRLGDLDRVSFFIAHGLHDPVIPVSFARRAQEILRRTHAHLTYQEYPIGHTVSEQSVQNIVGWLTQKIDAKEG